MSTGELIAEAREKLRLAEEKRVEGSFEALDLWKGVATEYAPRLADALEAATSVPVQGEPTDEQVEAAARALWELHARGDDPLWSGGELDYGIKQIYRKDARAALVAAAGAGKEKSDEL